MAGPAATAVLSQDPPQDVSAPAPVGPGPGWVLFDKRVVLGDRDSANPAAAAAVARTSNGRVVRVSLHRFAAPPASSCLELYTDDELYKYNMPCIVAADGDLLLLQMVLAVKNDSLADLTHNFFVYNVDLECPCMLSLPPLKGWNACGQNTSIARSGEGFVVANLMVCRDIDETTMSEIEMGTLWIYRSVTDKWETKKLKIPHDPKEGFVPYTWFTNTAFSFRGYGCWVDYHIGILYCDLLSPQPELGFLRFPGIEIWQGDRGRPDLYRTVSTCRGHVKFVNVDNGQFRFTGDEQEYSDSEDDEECIGCPHHNKESIGSGDEFSKSNDYECTITIWTLRMPEFEWVEDTTLQVEELWSLLSYQHLPLPRTVPTCPIISPQEADVLVLHFIFKEPYFFNKVRSKKIFFNKAWMLTVDMKKKSLGKHTLYENPIEAKDSLFFDHTNTFFGHPRVIVQLLG